MIEKFLPDPGEPLDPLGDADGIDSDAVRKNYAKVGSSRPSSLLYTYGPGSVMDLPSFTVMPAGLDDWDRIWARASDYKPIPAARLLEVVRLMLGRQVTELRHFPWQPKPHLFSDEGSDLGVPARVFPQWMRCTGCDLLATIAAFDYTNTNRYRPDLAVFEHTQCPGRRGEGKKGTRRNPVVSARYLLACEDGHVDEFPYRDWVHEGGPCPAAKTPRLAMVDRTTGKGASATVICSSCETRRPMNEAQGEAGRSKLPPCRGRMPHLGSFDPAGCDKPLHLMLVGASNLWFPALESVIVMPRLDPAELAADIADQIAAALGDKLAKWAANLDMVRDLLDGKVDVTELSDAALQQVIDAALHPVHESAEEIEERRRTWDPIDLRVPEWRYLQKDPAGEHHADKSSGLTLSPRPWATGAKAPLPPEVTRVLAVDRLRKVNALLGFTRIDEMSRVNDLGTRLAPLTRRPPKWVVATEDRGEGIFLQLDEERVAAWEARVAASELWTAHRHAHRRNWNNRRSDTSTTDEADQRFPPPRYWLLHSLSHVLLREMALYSGYSAASISERIYAWPADGGRPAAAGTLIVTTASDSDGTLGGLVRLSDPVLLGGLLRDALHRASRCSSDPVCACRVPRSPEDFLHGAACHACAFASETSCERANRFLDRRLLLNVGGTELGFFGDPG